MEVETFFRETRGSVVNLMSREVYDLDLVKVQTTAWIRFKVQVEDGDGNGNIIRVDKVNKVSNCQMKEVCKGSNLDEVIDERFVHMRTQIENLALANSRFMFD